MSFTEFRRVTRTGDIVSFFAAGAAVAAALHAWGGWWLNSGASVLRTVVVLLVAGIFAGLGRSDNAVVRACALWAGANVSFAAILFTIGPGTIFPIVLAVGALISAASVTGGVGLGFLIRRLRP
jgi:hypothetical protein